MAVDPSKVKERVVEWISELRDWLTDILEDFRQQTRYFKMRVGVLGGFTVLVVATLMIAPAPGIDNPIDVQVLATALPWGMRNKTIVEVRNNSGDDYENLMVTLYGSSLTREGAPAILGQWSYKKATLKEGRSLQIESKSLTNKKGEHPAPDFTPHRVEVRCEDGVYIDELKLRTMR